MTFTPAVVGNISTGNSTTTPLAAAGVFTGTWVDVTRYNSVVVGGSSDAPAATVELQFSTDGTNLDVNNATPISTTSFGVNAIVSAKFFRVVYTNGTGAQSTFRLQTSLKLGSTASSSSTSIISGGGSSILDPTLDAFGRLRVAEPTTLFDAKFQYNKQPEEWDEITSGTGGIAYTLEYPYISLSVNAGTGKAVRQTRRYHTYQPGKSFDILITGTLEVSGGITNVVARIGLFDDASDKTDATVSDHLQTNGYYFQLNGTTFGVVQRSYITGSLVTTTVNQSSFNIDRLDGTGPSGVTIDPSKRQIYFISLEWLGVGQVAMGIYIGSQQIPCHVFRHANLDSTLPYTNRGSLPVRYDISANSSGSTASMRQICCTVTSNGGFNPRGIILSESLFNDVVDLNSRSTLYPILAIRIDKTRAARLTINVLEASLVCTTSGNIFYRVYRVLAPTNPFTTASWNNANSTYSGAQIAVNNTFRTALRWASPPADANAVTIGQGYFANNTDQALLKLENRVICVADIIGNSDIIVIAALTLSGVVESVAASITWQEYS
ncbi:hypothetical protein KDA11_01995 [Candidatus Saccharibacteria bacterium]|nr:hypothetical protein [Candidatus Saccharibacteria bacterium]